MTTYFITGASGFIGKHLVKRLIANGERVVCLSRRVERSWHVAKNVVWVEADLLEPEKYQDWLRQCDKVIHLAGIINARRADIFRKVNVEGTEALLRTCLRLNGAPRKFLHISSIAAAGPGREPLLLKESDTPRPESEYGNSKLMAEQVVLAQAGNISSIIFRPAFIYGPGDSRGLNFLKLLTGQTHLISSTIIKTVSVCHVTDLIDACLLALSSNTDSGELFNISDPCTYTWHEMCRILEKSIQEFYRPLEMNTAPISMLKQSTGGSDKIRVRFGKAARYWGCDISKAKRILQFEANYRLTNGARDTIRWYRDNGHVVLQQPPDNHRS